MSCPICHKPTEKPYRPFCSKRCADIDLGKWFTGGYAIPSTDIDDAEVAKNDPQNMVDPKPH